MCNEISNIIFVGTCCSRTTYRSIIAEEQRISQQSQKYCTLLLQGIKKNGIEAQALGILPINRKNNKKIYIHKKRDEENGINFTYVPCINIPIVKRIFNFLGTIKELWRIISKNKNSVVIADPFVISSYLATLIVSRLRKKKIVGIVTDLPTVYAKRHNAKPTLTQRISRMLDNTCDGYICITNELNSVVNKSKKPAVIIEGFSDSNIDIEDNSFENKSANFIVLYAGGLYKQYGLEELVKGFINADIENSELHLYGNGPYVTEIEEISRTNEQVKYCGVRDNDYVLQEEKKAWVLINPRPILGFTKYSFPSKNMEYMSSGTYTATTNLPGMPKEYKEYVYIIEDSSAEGISQSLKKLSLLSKEDLFRRGVTAKKWILENRNNVVQMRKVIDMIKQL